MAQADVDGRTDRGRTPVTGEADLLGWVLAPVGLALVGAGLSVSIDAAVRRSGGAGARRWVGQGTVGLVVLNTGLSVFGDAVRRRSAAAGR